MSVGEAHRGMRTQQHRPSLWLIGLAALLVAAGFSRRSRTPSGQRPQAGTTNAGDGHGQSASTPSEIPVRGWKDILLRVYEGISNDRILANAAAVVFYALLALFPGIAALVSVYGMFADPQTITQQLDTAAGLLPGGAIDVIRDQLSRLAAQPRATLGASFVIGLGTSLWSANGGIKALFDALNVVYEEKEKRSFLLLNALSLGFTIGMLAFLLIAIAGIIALPIALDYLPGFMGSILNIARWPILLVIVALALSMLYRYGPSRRKLRWRWITWGSAFATVVWLGASGLFSWYAANFGNFNKTYGSLGAVIGFMTWMWLSIIVILIGAKLNAETEHQTARDSTERLPKPVRARQAKMADTVGLARSSKPLKVEPAADGPRS